MAFALYESMEDLCDNELIFENLPSLDFVKSWWCDDCRMKHYFSMVDYFDSIEEVWNFLQEEMEVE